MKIFGAINVTENKKNETPDGLELQTGRLSQIQENTLTQAMEGARTVENKAKLPGLLRFVQMGCGFVALCLFLGIMRARVPMDEAYANAPALFWALGATGAVWAVLTMLAKAKNKKVMSTDENSHTMQKLDRIVENGYFELGVPGEAKDTDILTFRYTEKDGKLKFPAFTMKLETAEYHLDSYKVYKKDDCLCLAKCDGVFSIPLSSIRGITMVKKNMPADGWSKDVQPNKGPYKPYKLNTDGYGRVHIKPYYILDFDHNGQSWRIYFPVYELSTFAGLTGHIAK